jgi:hypothetical protein
LRVASLAPPLLEDVGPAVVGELRALESARPTATPAAPAASPDAEVFRREGGLWRLSYAGTDAHLPNLKGLHDIARLLAAPGEEIHCLELAAGAAGAAAPAAEDGLAVQGHAGEVLDERGRAEFKRRIADLREQVELAEAAGDIVRAERAREELDNVTEALASAFGLGGRARRAGDPAERARSAVTWRIRSAVSKVEAAHPELGAHLRASVRTGTFCSYQPERPLRWTL